MCEQTNNQLIRSSIQNPTEFINYFLLFGFAPFDDSIPLLKLLYWPAFSGINAPNKPSILVFRY